MNKFNLRLESDKGITKLLRRHPKYYQEYQLNVSAQGYEHEVLLLFVPTLFQVALAERALGIMKDSLKKAGLI